MKKKKKKKKKKTVAVMNLPSALRGLNNSGLKILL